MHRWFKDINWTMVFSILALSAIGIFFIHSATHYQTGQYALKQIFWVCLGLVVFFTVTFMGYRTFLGISYLFYAIALILLVIVLIVGKTHMGAQRWLHLGPLVLQPSEFAKLATVLVLSNYLGGNPKWENEGRVLLTAMAIILIPLILIIKQPDLGTAMLFIPMVVVLFFLWGIRYRYLIGAVVMGILCAPLFWSFLKEYQKKRILVFLNPMRDPLGAGYTALQSHIAVGSGGLFGKGYLAGTQSQLDFVPEHHTDFIFCVIGEEWGYGGALILLVLYGLLIKVCFQVIASTTDVKAKLLAGGIVALLFSQIVVNIGMTIGFMPIAGLTLPLVSYGGSSLIATALALGLISSIYKERSIF